MPTVLRHKGYRFFFFSGESQEPRHIHVEYAEKYAKFWLNPLSLARSRNFRMHELSAVRKIIEENKSLLEEKWDEYFG
ncbi:MAG: DUF4160 domain-containing protein [Nitrosopumilus sp.]